MWLFPSLLRDLMLEIQRHSTLKATFHVLTDPPDELYIDGRRFE
jgi:hypothetical protein